MNPLLYEKAEGIATITFNRPAALNALTPEMLCRLADAVCDVAADDAIRVAVITAVGDKAFCAGGDLATTLPLLTGAREPVDEWDARLLNDPSTSAASALRGYALRKPVIAAVNGCCLAAGFELLLGTDIRIAADHAVFGLPEVTRALLPFAGSLARLPRQIPYCLAMELLLVGESVGAQDALRMGLINRVVPAAALLPTARALASRIGSYGPIAVQQIKRVAVETSGLPLDQAYLLEDEAKAVVLGSEDAREGPRAFVEKRAPVYRGR